MVTLAQVSSRLCTQPEGVRGSRRLALCAARWASGLLAPRLPAVLAVCCLLVSVLSATLTLAPGSGEGTGRRVRPACLGCREPPPWALPPASLLRPHMF